MIIIPTIAEMLLGDTGAMIVESTRTNKSRMTSEATKRTAFNPDNVLVSRERNADKPCSQCNAPKRHRAKSGRIYTSLCDACYSAMQAKAQKKIKSKRKMID